MRRMKLYRTRKGKTEVEIVHFGRHEGPARAQARLALRGFMSRKAFERRTPGAKAARRMRRHLQSTGQL